MDRNIIFTNSMLTLNKELCDQIDEKSFESMSLDQSVISVSIKSEESASLADPNIFPIPSLFCELHHQEITQGCTFNKCERPLYCRQCGRHQHGGQAPYSSLVSIKKFTENLAENLKKRQDIPNRFLKEIIGDSKRSENAKLIEWSEEHLNHLASIKNHIDSQKRLIEIDVKEIYDKLAQYLTQQQNSLFSQLDTFLANYQAEFLAFREYITPIFLPIGSEFNNLSNASSLNAKLNQIPSIQSQDLIKKISELIQMEQPNPPTQELKRIFEEMNAIQNNLPSYTSGMMNKFEGSESESVLRRQFGESHIESANRYSNLILEVQSKVNQYFNASAKNFNRSIPKLNIPIQSAPREVEFPLGLPPFNPHQIFSFGIEQLPEKNLFEGVENMSASIAPINVEKRNSIEQNPSSPKSKPKIPFFFPPFSNQLQEFNGRPSYSNSFYSSNGTSMDIITSRSQNLKNSKIFDNNSMRQEQGAALPKVYSKRKEMQKQHFFNKQSMGIPLKLIQRNEFSLSFDFPQFLCYLSKGYMLMVERKQKIFLVSVLSSTIIEFPQNLSSEVTFIASLSVTQNDMQDINTTLKFAISTADCKVHIFTFNTITQKLLNTNEPLYGFSQPVCRMIDLFSITGNPLIAIGCKNGEVSVYDYHTHIRQELFNRFHSQEITQLVVIPNRNSNEKKGRNRFASLGNDGILVIYEISRGMFLKSHIENVSQIGGGIRLLRVHPQFEQIFAVCNDGTLKRLKLDFSSLKLHSYDVTAFAAIKVKDFAVFSASDHYNLVGNQILSEPKDPQLSGVLFASDKDGKAVQFARTNVGSEEIPVCSEIELGTSRRKIIFVDTVQKLVIVNHTERRVLVYGIPL